MFSCEVWEMFKDTYFERHLQLYLKRQSGTGVFLWVLQNFMEHLLTEYLSATASVHFYKVLLQENSIKAEDFLQQKMCR